MLLGIKTYFSSLILQWGGGKAIIAVYSILIIQYKKNCGNL